MSCDATSPPIAPMRGRDHQTGEMPATFTMIRRRSCAFTISVLAILDGPTISRAATQNPPPNTQSREYRAYRGLIWLELGRTDMRVPFGPTGPEWVSLIERASFDRRLIGPSLDDVIDNDFDAWWQWLRQLEHCPHHQWPGFRMPLYAHEAQAYGRILLGQAAPTLRHHMTHAHINYPMGCGWNPCRVMSMDRQRAWLDSASVLPRRVPEFT